MGIFAFILFFVACFFINAKAENGLTIPVEAKQLNLSELINDPQILVSMQNTLDCIRHKTGANLLLLEDSAEESKSLEKIGIQPNEMVLESSMNAQQNITIQSFIANSQKPIAAIVECLHKFAPTEDQESCCKAVKSIPAVCTQICTNHADITDNLEKECHPHYDALRACYPRVKRESLFCQLSNALLPPKCVYAVKGAVVVGTIGAVTGNPIQAGIGFGAAAGTAIACGVAVKLCE